MNHHPSIEYVSYSQDNSVANATDSGKVSGDVSIAANTAFMGTSSVNSASFYIGLDLENYANSDKSQVLQDGIAQLMIFTISRHSLDKQLLQL